MSAKDTTRRHISSDEIVSTGCTSTQNALTTLDQHESVTFGQENLPICVPPALSGSYDSRRGGKPWSLIMALDRESVLCRVR